MKLLRSDLTSAFITFFSQTMGNYKQFIRDGKFDQQKFINSHPENLHKVRNHLIIVIF